ncbi:MAG TPA: carbamoyltransferase N-terminal domain-containing protein, partial [Mycobacterium sp.]|nr:carbamoyltransferase N-terminal domain-containing protein [Mycobacterium sp.]
MRILGINAVFHDPAAAVVVDGQIVAAAEEERFTRRKHGKQAVPFSTWELPIQSARWCLAQAGLTPADLDAVGYSYDPRLMDETTDGLEGLDRDWEYLRTMYAERAPRFLQSALPGLDPGIVRYVRHHVAHAASSAHASPHPDCAVLVVDGRGERTSMLAGSYRDAKIDVLATQALPHSLGLLYENLTEHLGFKRSSDEYKVMAMASYGTPRFADQFRELVYATGDGGFRTEPVDWSSFTPAREPGAGKGHALARPDPVHADLACSVQRVVEEVLLDLVGWLRGRTDHESLCLAGGVALNCVANSKIYAHGGFGNVWVQTAAGDAGTALGAALALAGEAGEPITPMPSAALGRGFSDDEIEATLREAALSY